MPANSINEKERILELDVRRKIYNLVQQYAGCHFREIERKSGLSTGSVKYHLDYLAKHNLIKREKEGNNLRYFPNNFKLQNTKLLGLLRQKSVRNILLYILINENCNHEQIVESVFLSPSTVSWHLKKLENNNIVRSVKEGRYKSYNILMEKEEIIRLLIIYKESFLDTLVDRVIEMWE
jgi:predicted transcriptional regulator